MNTLFLYNTKTLKSQINTKIFAGDNLITKINVQLPDNIGGYPKRECEFNLRAIIPEGNLSYIINPNEPYFYITNDITETAQTVNLMMIITHAGNVIGRTNTVDLQVREPAEAPDPPLTPREQFDERIAELENENEGLEREVAEQATAIEAKDGQISELNGQVTELEAENAEQAQTITRQNTTIDELNTRRIPVYIEPNLESKEITPLAETRYYGPSEGKDGFSSVTVDGVTVEGLGLNENYYKLGKPFLNKVGTYHPFPENSYGGIYFTELNEDDFPVGIKVVNYDYNYNNFSIPALNMNTLKNIIKSFILLDCKNVKIGNGSFAGASLLTICQLDGVLTIDLNAFQNCTSLMELTLPDSLTSISTNAFQNCTSLTELTLPDSLTSIGNNAFQGCTSLTEVNLPDSLTSIGVEVFQNCTSLTELTLPDSLTSIGRQAFYNCTSLTELTLPDSLTSIGGGAFYNCTSLTELTLPDSLTSIGGNAFQNCTSLTELTLPDSLTSIGVNAFNGCTSLTELTLAQGFNCNGLNVSYSTYFTAETIVACLEALADRTGLTAYTITFGSTNLNKLTAEQKAIATNKNWNLA